MLRAYIDASSDREQTIEVVAGVLATEEKWALFYPRWEDMLCRYNIHEFHASDYWGRHKEFKRFTDDEHVRIRQEICTIIADTATVIFGSIVSTTAFQEWRLQIGLFIRPDAHYFGMDRALSFLIHGVNLHPKDDGIEIICDEDGKHAAMTREMKAWHEDRLRAVKFRRPGAPDPGRPISMRFASSKQHPGLQVADIIANSSRQWGIVDLKGEPFEEPLFFTSLKSVPNAVIPFMSAERIEIEVKVRNRSQDQTD